MRRDHEEVLLRNAGLGARAFWHLARTFSDHASGRAPELPYFLIGAAMIFHRATVQKIHNMHFDSGIWKAIAERPDIIAGLQARMMEHTLVALKALQLGSASSLLQREGGEGFPTFRASGPDLPLAIRQGEESVSAIFNCARRLGAWFAAENLSVLQRQLNVEL